MTIFLTPTRAGLLQDIRDGDVHRDPHNTNIRYDYRPQWWNFTARTLEAIAAGWAEDGERSGNMWPVLLTAKGRSVLEEWESRNG
jgi:hypothetical protein